MCSTGGEVFSHRTLGTIDYRFSPANLTETESYSQRGGILTQRLKDLSAVIPIRVWTKHVYDTHVSISNSSTNLEVLISFSIYLFLGENV